MFRRSHCITPPSWSGKGDRPRVLLEHRDAWAYAAVLREHGFTVAACRGPDDESACPLVKHGACTAVDEADVILTGLPHEQALEVRRAVGRRRPDVPLVVESGPEAADSPPEGVTLLRLPPTPEELVRAVGEAACAVPA